MLNIFVNYRKFLVTGLVLRSKYLLLTYMFCLLVVAFQVYDINQDGFISNGELFTVLKMMVGNNLKEVQLQQIVDKTILQFDKDGDGKISYEEFCSVSMPCIARQTKLFLFFQIFM